MRASYANRNRVNDNVRAVAEAVAKTSPRVRKPGTAVEKRRWKSPQKKKIIIITRVGNVLPYKNLKNALMS